MSRSTGRIQSVIAYWPSGRKPKSSIFGGKSWIFGQILATQRGNHTGQILNPPAPTSAACRRWQSQIGVYCSRCQMANSAICYEAKEEIYIGADETSMPQKHSVTSILRSFGNWVEIHGYCFHLTTAALLR